MSYILNTTFVMAPGEEQRFSQWMRSEAIPVLFGAGSPAKGARMQKVVEVGGEKPGPEHGLSIALHAEFDSAEKAHLWNDTLLADVLAEFHKKFGPNALFFTTMLEIIPL